MVLDASCHAMYCTFATKASNENNDLWQQRKQLENLLKLSDTAEPGPKNTEPIGASQVIHNLPLWRIQTTVLPGAQEVLHVHVPHYTHMFKQLLARPRPWRFGHIYLPGGSINLGSPEYELAPGSRAPLTGTLMEILSYLWMEDGRLLVLAVGICRIRVAKTRQALPFSTADVEVWPDEEEVAAQSSAAMHAVDSCNSGVEMDMSAAMQTIDTAARAAAIAHSQVWHEYELAQLRALVNDEDLSNAVPGEGPRSKEAMFAPPKLLWRSVLASLQGLTVAPGGPPVGQDAFVLLTHQCEGHDAHREIELLLMEYADRAAEVASLAAELLAHRRRLEPIDAMGSHGLLPDATTKKVNATGDRGIPARGISEATQNEIEVAQRSDSTKMEEPSSELKEVLVLERLIWQTLDSIAVLAARAKRVVKEVLLPPAILRLRPTGLTQEQTVTDGPPAQSFDGTASSIEEPSSYSSTSSTVSGRNADAVQSDSPGMDGTGVRSHRQHLSVDDLYPPLRRAQRLAYSLATVLQEDFDHAEGRQAILEARTTAARLKLVLEVLLRQRNRLQALAALRVAGEG
ncbi:g2952 [Coccomyxa elongata]